MFKSAQQIINKMTNDGWTIEDDNDTFVHLLKDRSLKTVHKGRWPYLYVGKQDIQVWYRTLELWLPNPIGKLKAFRDEFKSDVKYAKMAYKSVRSGYQGLVEHLDGGWQFLEKRYFKPDVPWKPEPYFVCLQFENGGRIPLPIADDWRWGHYIQKLAIILAGGLPKEAYEQMASFQEGIDND